MSSKLINGLTIPILDGTVLIPTPAPGKITIFARGSNTVWVKFSDDTEERISVG